MYLQHCPGWPSQRPPRRLDCVDFPHAAGDRKTRDAWCKRPRRCGVGCWAYLQAPDRRWRMHVGAVCVFQRTVAVIKMHRFIYCNTVIKFYQYNLILFFLFTPLTGRKILILWMSQRVAVDPKRRTVSHVQSHGLRPQSRWLGPATAHGSGLDLVRPWAP